MCTLAFYFHVFPEYPLIIAANRDEALSRPSAPPTQLWASPWVYGGQDLLAGGTWLGINGHGVVAALLNRQTTHPPDPTRRSRGLLCLEALKHRSAAAATQFVSTQPATLYNPFNLLVADQAAAAVVYARGGPPEVHPLPAGTHLLTNRDLNDGTCPRISRVRADFSHLSDHLPRQRPALAQIFTRLHTLLAAHATDPDPRHSLCLHLDGYGTCSSTLVAYAAAHRRYAYHFAPGAPCRTAYREMSVPPGPLASHPPSTT